MSTVETKPVRLNWINADDDLSYVEGNASYRWDRKKINAV